MLYIHPIETPLGSMTAVADQTRLYLLMFADQPGGEQSIKRLKQVKQADLTPTLTPPIQQIQRELNDYFSGQLRLFKTPIDTLGSDFQKKAWHALRKIPYGQTRSYLEQAKAIGHPLAYRAVGNANRANRLAIIVPCHRVITHQGKLGGYAGGLSRKQRLLEHEQSTLKKGDV